MGFWLKGKESRRREPRIFILYIMVVVPLDIRAIRKKTRSYKSSKSVALLTPVRSSKIYGGGGGDMTVRGIVLRSGVNICEAFKDCSSRTGA